MPIEDSAAARLSSAAGHPSLVTPQPADANTNPFSDPEVWRTPRIPAVKRTRRAPRRHSGPRQIKMASSSYDTDGAVVRVPCLRMMGKWLEQAGFPIGVNLRITVEMGRLVIEPASPDLINKPAPASTRKQPTR
jgi:toxic protein SymE